MVQRKIDYDKVCDAIENEEASVELEGIDKDQLARIFQSVYLDWPEYFWLDCLQYTYNTNPTGVILNLNYNYTGAEREKREAIEKQQSEEILAGVPAGGSDYDKVKYVFETLVDMTEYDLSAPDNQNIYSVFGNWTRCVRDMQELRSTCLTGQAWLYLGNRNRRRRTTRMEYREM